MKLTSSSMLIKAISHSDRIMYVNSFTSSFSKEKKVFSSVITNRGFRWIKYTYVG